MANQEKDEEVVVLPPSDGEPFTIEIKVDNF